MRSKFLTIFILLFSLSLPLFAKDIKILAVDIYGDNIISKRWVATIDYLNKQIPEHSFSLVSLKPYQVDQMKALIKQQKVDFIITQPAIYVDLERNTGISKILTLIKDEGISQLGSVIFSKKGSEIKLFEDVKNKKVAAVAPLGFGGWLIGYDEFLKKGIDLYKDASLVTFLGTQNNVIDAVVSQRVDVGIVRTGLIETLISKGQLKLDELNIINQTAYKNFSKISSTKLYPEWAFANTPHIENSISKKVATALLSIPKGSDVALQDHYWEWTTPYDYKPVHDLLKKLEVGAYKDYKKITFSKYKYEILFIIGVFITIMGLLIAIIRRNIIIKQEEKRNIKLQEQFFRSQKLTAMSELIGNIGHQWRQPLSIISTAATGIILQKEQDKPLDEKEIFLTCEAINDNAQYLSRTIDTFTRYIKIDCQKDVFSMKKNITNFIYFIEGSIDINNIDIMVDVEDVELIGYPGKLIQCYINLFNNSKDKFNEIEAKERLIFVTAYKEDDKVIIKFKDNGGGADEAVVKSLFEPYFTTRHKYQGKGLSLHNTYNILVHEIGASIEVKNTQYNYNKKIYSGLEFIISIPLEVKT